MTRVMERGVALDGDGLWSTVRITQIHLSLTNIHQAREAERGIHPKGDLNFPSQVIKFPPVSGKYVEVVTIGKVRYLR